MSKIKTSARVSAPSGPDKPEGQRDRAAWDRIDEAGWESFPASDAPSSWAGTDREPKQPRAEAERDEGEDEWASASEARGHA